MSDETTEIEADVVDGRVLVSVDALPDALGWTLKPEGLCRGDICVPVRDPRRTLFVGEQLDLAAVADALGRPTVVDADAGHRRPSRSTGSSAAPRSTSLTAPDVTLRDLDGDGALAVRLARQKRLLHAFSSWCGCRYDLPGWQALQDELGDENFTVIAVAIDESPDDVRPWTDEVTTMPVLIDPQHVLTEVYAISNVPDGRVDRRGRHHRAAEQRRLLQRHVQGVHRRGVGPHLDAVRAWVRDGTTTIEPGRSARPRCPTSPTTRCVARLHFRVAAPRRAAMATTTPRSGTSSGPASWRRWTSRSGAPRCRSRAATRSARSSWSYSASGRRRSPFPRGSSR